MHIKNVDFVGSWEHEHQCPKADKPEYAFIGRSNVGKSSLINMLTSRKSLARVSNTPGKTQTLNYFNVDDSWFLVDLPGYGYAKISKKMKDKWERMIEKFLMERRNLMCTFVLIDSRHDLQQIDMEFINWMGLRSIPFAIVYTKTDKLSRSQIDFNIDRIRTSLLQHWEELPDQFITSSEKAIGREEILEFIGDLNNKY